MKSQSYPELLILIQADRKYQCRTNRQKDLHALRCTKQSTVSTSFKTLALVEDWVLFLSVVFLHMMSCGEVEKHLLVVYLNHTSISDSIVCCEDYHDFLKYSGERNTWGVKKKVFLTYIHSDFFKEGRQKREQNDNFFFSWMFYLRFPGNINSSLKVSVIKCWYWYSEYCIQVFILGGNSAAVIFQWVIYVFIPI